MLIKKPCLFNILLNKMTPNPVPENDKRAQLPHTTCAQNIHCTDIRVALNPSFNCYFSCNSRPDCLQVQWDTSER